MSNKDRKIVFKYFDPRMAEVTSFETFVGMAEGVYKYEVELRFREKKDELKLKALGVLAQSLLSNGLITEKKLKKATGLGIESMQMMGEGCLPWKVIMEKKQLEKQLERVSSFLTKDDPGLRQLRKVLNK